MAKNQDQLKLLLDKLDLLMKRQESFGKEINELREEIYALKLVDAAKVEESKPLEIKTPIVDETIPVEPTKIDAAAELIEETEELEFTESQKEDIEEQQEELEQQIKKQQKRSVPKFDFSQGFEKFIGENLLSKLGIISIIIAVAIGAKYSIDNELISPQTRIILGYAVGIALLGFGMKLKSKYETFSAVLVSGAIAIFYFLTFFAYDFYGLIPQVVAFVMMVVFTVFSVVAALNYNKQIIAHIGLVGAYAVPFLLSSGSGQIEVLFSYMAIINIGILIIAFKKYWKNLYHSAFFFTWTIFAFWSFDKFNFNSHFNLGIGFSLLFFLIFYVTFLAYKFIKKEQFSKSDVVMLLLNSFIFYGFGFFMLNEHPTSERFLGIFTLANAVLHFIVSVFTFKQNLADKKLFYLLASLVLVFISIAIPVQLDGSWVTLLWAVQAALLFWLARTKAIPVFEYLSYTLMTLAAFSFFHDYVSLDRYYFSQTASLNTPILNVNFLTSILFVFAFGFIVYLNQHKNYSSAIKSRISMANMFTFLIPAFSLLVLYLIFLFEIELYFDNVFKNSLVSFTPDGSESPRKSFDYTIWRKEDVWLMNYSLLFVAVLSLVNIKFLKNKLFGKVCIGLNVLAILAFLGLGLDAFSNLQHNYLSPANSELYPPNKMNILLRYISYPFVALVLYTTYLLTKKITNFKYIHIGFDLLLHTTLLAIASFEVTNLMELADSGQSYKLGLSILWGIYALVLIVLGLWKKKKHLRLFAIALFAITLIKLFFYDISHLNTIAKTVVFLALGILLLIVSFLYAKYKDIITDEVEN